jgi:hypothetical protein
VSDEDHDESESFRPETLDGARGESPDIGGSASTVDPDVPRLTEKLAAEAESGDEDEDREPPMRAMDDDPTGAHRMDGFEERYGDRTDGGEPTDPEDRSLTKPEHENGDNVLLGKTPPAPPDAEHFSGIPSDRSPFGDEREADGEDHDLGI